MRRLVAAIYQAVVRLFVADAEAYAVLAIVGALSPLSLEARERVLWSLWNRVVVSPKLAAETQKGLN